MPPAFTLPNLLTATRLLMAPMVVWLIVQGATAAAFGWFVAAALTDLLDGSLARWLDQKTVLGAWLDPIADKAMLLGTLLALAWAGSVPVWLAVVVLARDAVVLGGAGAFRLLTGRLEVAPTLSGKAATFAEFTLVSLILAELAFAPGLTPWLPPLILLTAFLVVASGLHYVWLWSRKTRDFLRGRQPS
ncbi:MAG: CDP-alcohol phosphatidyltransferase family protein [Thiobacillaceae bacterium]|nr:CDP-alcohol phosphatidyltransferase family protein [Thiobacillaceae bacterium]MCX7672420.1 CDP-alcohol phosphatidyltransferase family protein [Thiobacillaceae bacterium]MDW8323624.1 CDP-alcohol phosphatidyltransferase family protein [Burkholderiales bacterium]